MIYDIALIDSDGGLLFWRRSVEGFVNIEPDFITELIGQAPGEVASEGEIRTLENLDGRTLVVHHDGDKIGLAIIKRVVEENLKQEPQVIIEKLLDSLIPTVDELEILLDILPKKPIALRRKRPGVIKRFISKLKPADVKKAYVEARFEDVILGKPKDDVERLLRINAGVMLRQFPPKYPAPSFEELENMARGISNEILREIAEALLERLRTGIPLRLFEVLSKYRGTVVSLMRSNPYVAAALVGPALSNPKFVEVYEIVKRAFPGTYWERLAETYVTAMKANLKGSLDRAIALLGTYKSEYASPEEEFLCILRLLIALEKLTTKSVEDVDEIANRISEIVLDIVSRLLRLLDESPKVFASRLLMAAQTAVSTAALIGLYKYHTTGELFRPYIDKAAELLEKSVEKAFEFLEYARVSPMAALLTLSNTLFALAGIQPFLREDDVRRMQEIVKTFVWYVSEGAFESINELLKLDKSTYSLIAASLIGAVAANIEMVEPQMREYAMNICKFSGERLLVSKYAEEPMISSALGGNLPKVRAYLGATEMLVSAVIRLLKKRLGNSLRSKVVLGEIVRTLHSSGRRELAELACREISDVMKSIVCERLIG